MTSTFDYKIVFVHEQILRNAVEVLFIGSSWWPMHNANKQLFHKNEQTIKLYLYYQTYKARC